MKILTKEEEQAHYYATLKGGTIGGVVGLGVGFAGVALASRRYHFIRHLTLPLKAFLVTSAGTFAGIISADHSSRAYETARNPKALQYQEEQREKYAQAHEGMTFTERAMDFGKKERYKIVGASWVASMAAAFALVNRNKYLTGAQKLVQARVYAQFLTLGVLVASAAFEIADSKNEEGKMWETVQYIDPSDPEHKRVLEKRQRKEGAPETEESQGDTFWKDMVAAEEERLKEKEEHAKELRHKKGKGNGKKKDDGEEKPKDDKKSKKD